MNATERQLIDALLADPGKLKQKKPFFRGVRKVGGLGKNSVTTMLDTVEARLPRLNLEVVTQDDYIRELDVYSHKVLFDENVPSITIKASGGGYLEMEQYRMAIPFQQIILEKQVRHLCVNMMEQTLENQNPTEAQQKNFVKVKQEWLKKNMEGAKTQFVKDQKSYGDAALLFYMDGNNKICTRNINYADGYVIITHKDGNGKHILECLYYENDDIEYLDCYDDEYITRFTNEPIINVNAGTISYSMKRYPPVRHGFSENPLITKRGPVAWDKGQPTIESYEALFNTFIVIQKRNGWGLIYIKGKFNDNARRIAGNVILNDTSGAPEADAKILNPPAPSNMTDTLDFMEYTIQKATGTTFILPKDIKISGDTSGLAVELTQELDMATAQDGVIEWQNVSNKMMRLFVEGLAKELVSKGEKGFENAVTEFQELSINNKFTVWKPKSEEGHNQMVATMVGAGILSKQTGVEKNTLSTPDELARIKRETEEAQKQLVEQTAQATTSANSEEIIDVIE
jgi:hypothetical protein